MNKNWKEIELSVKNDEEYLLNVKKILKPYKEKMLAEDVIKEMRLPLNYGALHALAGEGKYIYYDGKILQAIKVGNMINYYTANNNYYCESTIAKAMNSEQFKPFTNIDTSVSSLFTGDFISINTKGGVNKVCHTDKVLDNYNQGYNLVYVDGKTIKRDLVLDKRFYGHGCNSYHYPNLNFNSESITQYIPAYFKGVEDTKKIKCSSVVGVFYIEKAFYYNISNWKKKIYKLPTYIFEDMTYTVIDDMIYYVVNDEVKSVRINDEYSIKLKAGVYARFLSGELKLEKTPYAEFPRIYTIDGVDNIVINCDLFSIDTNDYVFESGLLVKNNSLFETTSEYKCDDYVIPYRNIFFIIRENKVYVFDKEIYREALRYAHISDGLTLYKNIRFSRKKTYFFVSNEALYISNSYCSTTSLSFEKYRKTSLKAVSQDMVYIEGIDGKKYIVSYYGNIVELKLNAINKNTYFSYDSDTITIVNKENDATVIQCNNFIFKLVNDELFVNDIKLLDGVSLDKNILYIYNKSSSLEKDMLRYKFYLSTEYDYLDYQTQITFPNENIFFFHSPSLGGYCLVSKKDNVFTRIESDMVCKMDDLNLDAVRILVENCKTRKSEIKSYIINGWHINEPYINRIGMYDNALIQTIASKINHAESTCCTINAKEKFLNELRNATVSEISSIIKEKGLKLSHAIVNENLDNRDFIDVMLNLNNIESHTEDAEFECLISEINRYYNNDVNNNAYIEKINKHNMLQFMEHGISIDKFNSFDKKLEFVAHPAGVYTIKNSLQETVFSQIETLIGSIKYLKPGIFRISSIDDLIAIEDSIYNKTSDTILAMKETCNDKATIRNINSFGKSIFKFLKSYGLQMDYVNREVLLNGAKFVNSSLEKINGFVKKFISLLDSINIKIESMYSETKWSSELIMLNIWCQNHLINSLDSLDVKIKDLKSTNLEISLWDRQDIIRNLTQGTRSQCCISVSSFNIGALVGYIFNKNITLVEITENNKIIGQAFVYLGVSREKLQYRYDLKKHIFMLIDNVELNNNYLCYATEIGKNLQRFMFEYMNYVSADKISDVFLGTSLNDIDPPYEFKENMDLSVIGNSMYRDSTQTFYKFL